MNITEIEALVANLDALLKEAEALQWRAAPVRPASADERGTKSGYSDPTANVALDEGRLKLREEIEAAKRYINRALQLMVAQQARLERAVCHWYGDPRYFENNSRYANKSTS